MENVKDLLNIDNLEDKYYEFELLLESDKDKVEKQAKSIVGFANTCSGHILVGVTNDGYIKGLTNKEIDETKNLILLTINRYVFPRVTVEFKVVTSKENKKILSVFVDYVNELVVYKAGDYNEKVYIRDDGRRFLQVLFKSLR